MHFQWLQHSRGGGGGGQQQVKPEPVTGDVVMEALPSHGGQVDIYGVHDENKSYDDIHLAIGWLSFSDGGGYYK